MPVVLKVLVIVGAGGRIVRVSVAEPVPPPLEALIVAANVPVTVGVPEIRPLEGFTLRPFGNPVAPKLVGLLLPAI